jgi:CRISPR-associated protein Cas2
MNAENETPYKKLQKGRHWYLIAYDVRSAKRLRKLHYYLKKRALALQKSLFMIRTDQAGLHNLLVGIQTRVKDREDDVRLYPIGHPNAIWVAGLQHRALRNLYTGSEVEGHRPVGVKGLIKRIFRRNRS